MNAQTIAAGKRGTVNLGLNLKNAKKGLQAVGLSRCDGEDKWLYSLRAGFTAANIFSCLAIMP